MRLLSAETALPFASDKSHLPFKGASLSWRATILLLLAAAALLRLYGLGSESLWHDELFSADIALNRGLISQSGVPFFERIALGDVGAIESFWTIKAADQSPPLFELLNKFSIFLFGDSESGVRALSALAALAFLAWLGWRTYRHAGTRLGVFYLATLAIYATSGFMIFYAQEARAYSLGAALSGTALVLFFERALRGWKTAPLPQWPEVCLFIAAAMTHYNLTALAGMILSVYCLEAWRRKEWRALLRMSSVLVVVLAWLLVNRQSFLNTTEGQFGWVHVSYGEALLIGLRGVVVEVLGWLNAIAVLATVMAAVFFAARFREPTSGATASSQENWKNATWALASLAAAYFLVMTWIMQKSQILHLRHYIFPATIFYPLFAIAVSKVWQRSNPLGWIFLAIIIATQWPLIKSFHSAQKADFRGATASIVKHLDDGDIVFTDFMLNPAGYDYYLKRKAPKTLVRQPYYIPEDAHQVCQTIQGRSRFALLRASSRGDLSDALNNACGQGYKIQRSEFFKLTTEIWEKQP